MRRIFFIVCFLSGFGMNIFPSYADGGISIHATRIIYQMKAKQDSISVENSSNSDYYLVQSWVEKPDGHKSSDFVVTPPLYVSDPHSENTLRIMLMRYNLPQDKESLYYFVVKAIPGEEKKPASKSANSLKIAAASRIKLFIRPETLPSPGDETISRIVFQLQGNLISINNPTPYYFTLTQLKSGKEKLKDIMVAPKSTSSLPIKNKASGTVNFRIINDFGAISKYYSSSLHN